jgi:hypothetical protein
MIRRVQYQINFAHILTFSVEYRRIFAPYFGFENIQYGIERENTHNEGIRLIFKSEHYGFVANKEGITMIYEGNPDDLKNANGTVRHFWEIYDKIRAMTGYTRTTRHHITIDTVEITDAQMASSMQNDYLKINPFGQLNEFACVYEFHKDDASYKLQVGNFSDRDIQIRDLMPFQTSWNADLIDGKGHTARLEITEEDKSPTYGKFKSMLAKSESIFEKFNLK